VELDQIYDWMAGQNSSTNVKFSAVVMAAISITTILIMIFKISMRLSTRWHPSPLATALIFFHLFGNLKLNTLSNGIRSNGTQNFLEILYEHARQASLRKLKGPAANLTIYLAIWEVTTFFLSLSSSSSMHIGRGIIIDWIHLLVLIGLAAMSVDLKLASAISQKKGQWLYTFASQRDGKVSIKDGALTVATFLVVGWVIALILALTFGRGRLIGHSYRHFSHVLADHTPYRLSQKGNGNLLTWRIPLRRLNVVPSKGTSLPPIMTDLISLQTSNNLASLQLQKQVNSIASAIGNIQKDMVHLLDRHDRLNRTCSIAFQGINQMVTSDDRRVPDGSWMKQMESKLAEIARTTNHKRPQVMYKSSSLDQIKPDFEFDRDYTIPAILSNRSLELSSIVYEEGGQDLVEETPTSETDSSITITSSPL
jgi:hypothetical protein